MCAALNGDPQVAWRWRHHHGAGGQWAVRGLLGNWLFYRDGGVHSGKCW